MIILKTLSVKNFASHENTTVQLDDQGAILITGLNGRGKSSLVIDAIEFALYGKTERHTSLKPLVMSGKDSATVSLIGEANGHSFEITRTIGSKSDHKLTLLVDGHDSTGIHIASTQEEIDSLIRTPWQVFTNLLTLQGEPILFSESDSFQKSFMEKMLGIDYEKCYDLTNKINEELKTALLESESEYKSLEHDEEVLLVQSRTLQENEEKIRAEHIKELQANIETINKSIDELQSNIEEKKKFVESKNKQFVPVREEIKALEDEVDRLKREYPTLEFAQNRYDYAVANRSKVCPECNRPWDESQLEAHIKKYLEELNRAKEGAEKIKQIQERLNFLYDRSSKIMKQIQDAEEISRTYLTQRMVYSDHKCRLEAQLEDIKNRPLLELREIEEKIENIRLEKKALEERILGYQEKKRSIEECFEAFGDKGIKSLMIEQALTKISDRMNEILYDFTDGDLSCCLLPIKELKTKKGFRDKMTLKIIRNSVPDCVLDYENASKGQRALANVAAAFAFQEMLLSKRGVRWGILSMDEVLESLDEDVLPRVASFIAKMASKIGTILLTSHRKELAGLFPSVWEIKMVNGVSQVEFV